MPLPLRLSDQFGFTATEGKAMLYEEKIVDGVLCWRMSPRDCKGYSDWIPKTAQELTALVLELRQRRAAPMPAPQLVPHPWPAPQWVHDAPWHPPFVVTCAAGGQ